MQYMQANPIQVGQLENAYQLANSLSLPLPEKTKLLLQRGLQHDWLIECWSEDIPIHHQDTQPLHQP